MASQTRLSGLPPAPTQFENGNLFLFRKIISPAHWQSEESRYRRDAIQQVIGRTYIPMPLYVLGALIYFVINYSLSSASRRLEARFAYIRE